MQLFERERMHGKYLEKIYLILLLTLITFGGMVLPWILMSLLSIWRKRKPNVRLKIFDHVLFLFALISYLFLIGYMIWNSVEIFHVGEWYILSENPFTVENAGKLPGYLIVSSLALGFLLLLIQLNPPLRRKKPTPQSARPYLVSFIIFAVVAIICVLFFAWVEKNISILLLLGPMSLICALLACVPQFIAERPMRILPKRIRRPLHNRLVQILLLSTFLAGVTHMGNVRNLWWSFYLGLFLIVFFSALIISTPPTEKCPSGFTGFIFFFSKSLRMRRSRTRYVKLLVPYLFILWAAVVFVQAKLGVEFRKARKYENYLALLLPLPEANEQTYQSVLHELPYCHLKPSDLERFVKEKPIVNYNSGIDWDSKEHIFVGELISSIPDCSPESYRIILNHLKDPNEKYALLERAAWGDSDAKAPLIQLYNEHLKNIKNQGTIIVTDDDNSNGRSKRYGISKGSDLNDSISEGGEILHALSCLSSPKENESRFREWIDIIDWKKIFEYRSDYEYGYSYNYSLYEHLSNLQPGVASHVLQYYLEKTEYRDLEYLWGDIDIKDSLRKFGNRQVSENILQICFNIILQPTASTEREIEMEDGYYEEESPEDLLAYYCWDIARHLEPASIPLLEEYLYQTDHGPRAFIVSQLNRFHYFWHPDSFQDLAHDPCWKVRLNMLLYLDYAKLQQACQDEELIVKTVAQILAKN